MAKRKPDGFTLPACTHRKSTLDPHPECRRCRSCVFFTNECDICMGMSSDVKTNIEHTWMRSDARQKQRVRASSHSRLEESSSDCVSSSPLVPRKRRAPFLPTGQLTDSESDSNMAAIVAENAALRDKLAAMESAMLLPIPPQPPDVIFGSPSKDGRFHGFDPTAVATTSMVDSSFISTLAAALVCDKATGDSTIDKRLDNKATGDKADKASGDRATGDWRQSDWRLATGRGDCRQRNCRQASRRQDV